MQMDAPRCAVQARLTLRAEEREVFIVRTYLENRSINKTAQELNESEYYIRKAIKRFKSALDRAVRTNGSENPSYLPSYNPRDTGTRHIYVARCGDAYKIGVAADPGKRIAAMSTSSARPILLLYSRLCKDAHAEEKRLHARFADRRIRGEWFNLTPDDLAEISNGKISRTTG